MALNIDKIQFYVSRIEHANSKSFKSEIRMLFTYLDLEAIENGVYIQYDSIREKWKHWPSEEGQSSFYYPRWEMPNNEDDCKSLSYDLYKTIATMDLDGGSYADMLFPLQNHDLSIIEFNQTFLDYFKFVLEEIINANAELTENNKTSNIHGNNVFIIHGHDNFLKTEVQLLLERAKVNHIVLHEQPNKGRTIIEKLIEEGDRANFAVALLTPDDLVKDGQPRARQNVIWEAGYFLGKLGRNRVLLLKKEELEIPTDLHGIIYESYDKAGAWKMKVLKEIQAVGIYVDLAAITATI